MESPTFDTRFDESWKEYLKICYWGLEKVNSRSNVFKALQAIYLNLRGFLEVINVEGTFNKLIKVKIVNGLNHLDLEVELKCHYYK